MTYTRPKIRTMTTDEREAKRSWESTKCAVPKCPAEASFLVEEVSEPQDSVEWWEYRCEAHARQFAIEHIGK